MGVQRAESFIRQTLRHQCRLANIIFSYYHPSPILVSSTTHTTIFILSQAAQQVNPWHAMHVYYSFIFSLFMVSRGSSFLRHASALGGGLYRRQQTRNALVHDAPSTSVAQYADDTTTSNLGSSESNNLRPYFSIYYNGKSTNKHVVES